MLLDHVAPVLAQAPPPQAPAWLTLVPVALIGVAMYFALIRPQQKRARELGSLLQALRPGDKVVTSSGIVGTIVSVKEKTISLRSAETKLEILKSAVTEVTERSSAEPAES